MRRLIATTPQPKQAFVVASSIVLWAMLWLSISPGDPGAILNPGSPWAFLHGLRAAFPLMAGGTAAIIIGVKLVQGNPRTFSFFGPLGLATTYGLVGLAASLNSPDGSVALWWATLYLSVPIVLWGVAWSATPLVKLRRLLDASRLIVILATMALFAVAALYLDLIDKILDPAQLLRCDTAEWFDLTSGQIRGTGVGRYAAIAGLISFSGLWQHKWRPTWIIVFLTSVTLLLYTSARGSFVGFGLGATLILLIYLIYSSKRVLWASLFAILVFVPLIWSTGAPIDFMKTCLLRVSSASPLFIVAPLETGPAVLDPEPSKVAGAVDSQNNELTADSKDLANVSTTPSASSQPPLPHVVDPIPAAQTQQPAADSTTHPVSAAPFSTLTERIAAKNFFKLSGRTDVWLDSWNMIKDSPLIGFGFHADRLLLGTHMHNSVLHALLQAGLIGTLPFVAGIIFSWVLFFRIVRNLTLMSGAHKHLVIQCGGVLAFLTMRSVTESTGAFFGVDWLILSVILFYLQIVAYGHHPLEVDGAHRIFERA